MSQISSSTGDAPVHKPRFWDRLSIVSKLLLMLVLVSALSSAVVGVLGYRFGADQLRIAAFDRMTALREARKQQLEQYFANLSTEVRLTSTSRDITTAMADLGAAYSQLDSATLTAEQNAELDAFYRDGFLPQLAENVDGTPAVEGYLPTTPAQRYLQYHYTRASLDFEQSLAVTDPGDGSAYSAAHARLHESLRRLVALRDFEDLLLIDNQTGDVIYTAYKGVDLGTNLETGPYANTLLGEAFQEVRASSDVDYVRFTDIEDYRPSLGRPTLFVLSPIYADGRILGTLALQISTDALNRRLSSNDRWADVGFGQTGQAYLVGQDGLMRSNSRQLAENPEQYAADLRAAGTPEATVERILRTGTTVLQQPIRTEAADEALRGASDTRIVQDFRGREQLSSFAPLNIPGQTWAIITEVNRDEALAPVQDFTRLVAILVAGMVLLATLLGLGLAQLLARPLRRLTAAVRELSGGNLNVVVPTTSQDEIGVLGRSFNEMSSSLRVKADLIEQQRQEYERVLRSVMPDKVAEQFKAGADSTTFEQGNVAVLFANVANFAEVARRLPAGQGAELLNALVREFDEAAEALAIEKVRTVGASYLAASGLTVPRIDNLKRIGDFARRLQGIVQRFNRQRNLNLELHIGIDSGTVMAGLVGRTRFIYDMWGDAVNLSSRMCNGDGKQGILVSNSVYERLRDSQHFEPAGEVHTPSGSEPVWLMLSDVAVEREREVNRV